MELCNFSGAKVVMSCRSLEKPKTAAEDIKNITEVSDVRLVVMHLDLASIKSIRQFALEFKTSQLLVLL